MGFISCGSARVNGSYVVLYFDVILFTHICKGLVHATDTLTLWVHGSVLLVAIVLDIAADVSIILAPLNIAHSITHSLFFAPLRYVF